MLLAKRVKSPVILVSDIERGGCFASILGTIILLKSKHRNLIKGILINKFLGDEYILIPAIKKIQTKINKPFLGIIPKIEHNIPAEDSLDGQKKEMNHIEISEPINKEIDKVSKIIESTIDMDYILKKILK